MRNLINLTILLGLFVLPTAALSEDKDVDSYTKVSDWPDVADDTDPGVLFKKVVTFGQNEAGIKLNSGVTDFDLRGPFVFPDNADFDHGKPRKDSVFGIDISHYTSDKIKFSSLKRLKVAFVYMKATQGLGKDKKFANFWAKARQVPQERSVYQGAYHFLSANVDGQVQGRSFARFLLLNGTSATDLPPVMDLEWDISSTHPEDRWIGQSPKQIVASALACLSAIKSEYAEKGISKTPILYTSRAWLNERGIGKSEFAELSKFPIWIADYGDSHRATEDPHTVFGNKPQFWQFAADARVPDQLKKVDVNIFKGTDDEFKAAFQLP